MSIIQVGVTWLGFSGAPGRTTLNFRGGAIDPIDGMSAAAAADDFAAAMAVVSGTGVSLQVDSELKWFDAASGDLLGLTGVDPVFGPHNGGGGALGPLPTGACVSWGTSGVHDHPGSAVGPRPVRGKTYVVPLAAAYYQSDGSLTAVAVSSLTTAAVALIGADDATFTIWARPVAGAGGADFPAVTAHVADRAAVLRSRRD